MQLEYMDRTVADIVRDDYRTADVFKKYGINFCCGGQLLLGDACEQRNIDPATVNRELQMATHIISLPNCLKYDTWRTDFLVDYIINVHHAYLFQVMPQLEASLLSFVEGHRKKYPDLEEVLVLFRELSAMLQSHNTHEEEIIFPYIKQIENTYRRKETYGNLFVRTLRKPLSNIETEHKKIGALLNELRTATRNYQYPENACTNHRVIYQKLKEFDQDMVQHKHLENNILFPKAIEIEKELLRL